MIKVPIFNELKNNDSTVYYFSESNNDLLALLTSSNSRRVPSKFACIKLPKWQNLSFATRQLFLDPVRFSSSPLITDPNQLFPALMQNYMENAIAYAKTDDVFDYRLTEAMFWKMLSETGTTDFDVSIDGKYIDTFGDDLIQYIGDINVMNNMKYKDEEYSELYLHIPHDAKKINGAKWKTNPQILQTTSQLPLTGTVDTISLGLASSSIDLKNAITDTDIAHVPLAVYDFTNPQDRLTLDLEDYTQVSEEFDYNAILIYYDTYDANVAGSVRRKLGGIFFVDDFTQEGLTGTYTISPAVKQLNTLLTTGNSLAHRINSRFFYGNNTIDVQTVVNQYNTISMDLYMEALQRLLQITDKYELALTTIESLQTQVANSNNLISEFEQIQSLNDTVLQLQQELNDITAGNTQLTQITTQELLAVFDELVGQFNTLQSNPNAQFTNTFVFNDGTQTGFDDFYVTSGPTSNSKLVSYANNSWFENISFNNASLTPFDIVTNKISSTVLELTLVALTKSITDIEYRYYDTLTKTYGLDTFSVAAATLQINFATTQETMHLVLVYEIATTTFMLIDAYTMINANINGYIVLGVFVKPSETQYDNFGLSIYSPVIKQKSSKDFITLKCTDETVSVTTVADLYKFRIPYGFQLNDIRASLNIAQAAGNLITIDVKKNGVSMLSTLLTFDNTQSTTKTATIPHVLSTYSIDEDDEITIETTDSGDGSGEGLKVTLSGYRK